MIPVKYARPVEFPLAQTDVAISRTIGGSFPAGIAKQRGFVPSCFDFPPYGAT